MVVDAVAVAINQNNKEDNNNDKLKEWNFVTFIKL
jgi:hypothetical protein